MNEGSAHCNCGHLRLESSARCAESPKFGVSDLSHMLSDAQVTKVEHYTSKNLTPLDLRTIWTRVSTNFTRR